MGLRRTGSNRVTFASQRLAVTAMYSEYAELGGRIVAGKVTVL
jgi:hypothetical protein